MEGANKEVLLLKEALPLRPSADQYDVARVAIARAEYEFEVRLQELAKERRSHGILQAAFEALQEMREHFLRIQMEEQRRPWLAIVEAEERHRRFDKLVLKFQAAGPAGLMNGHARPNGSFQHHSSSSGDLLAAATAAATTTPPTADADFGGFHKAAADTQLPPKQAVKTPKSGTLLYEGLDLASASPIAKLSAPAASRLAAGGGGGGVDTPNATVESTFQTSATAESRTLSTTSGDTVQAECPAKLVALLQAAADKRLERVEIAEMFTVSYTWVPDMLGQLRELKELVMPGNRIVWLPDALGELEQLTLLDVQSNQLTSLPNTLGNLKKLKVLNLEKNFVEELPYSIRECESLEELRADFNKLKVLPEAIGYLSNLRILSVRLNCLKGLPTTLGYLTELTVVDAYYNQLESIPESLCFLEKLRKLNVSTNCQSLRSLPYKIGHLKSLVELDISYNGISELPDSFVMLSSSLQRLFVEGNPWKLPPIDVVERGRDAIFEYMRQAIKQREQETLAKRKRSFFARLLFACVGCVKSCSEQPKGGDPGLNILA